MSEKVKITGGSIVGDLLDRYPFLEETMISLSPLFRNLQNPVLRRTAAKVATLAHGAAMTGVPLAKMLEALRKALEEHGFECEGE